MNTKKKIFLAIVFMQVLTVLCLAQSSVVVSVNGEKITLSEFREMVAEAGENFSARQRADDDVCKNIKKYALNRGLNDIILKIEAKNEQVNISEEEFQKWITKQGVKNPPLKWQKLQRQRLINQKLLDKIQDKLIPLKDEEIEKYYKANKADFTIPARWHLQEITVKDEDTANMILKQLEDGKSFTELAKQYSLSLSAENGGDIGFTSSLTLPDDITPIIEKLKVGKVSSKHKTAYGYQIFELIEKKPSKTPPLSEIRDVIKAKLRAPKREELLKKWFDDLKKKFTINIDEKTLGDTKC